MAQEFYINKNSVLPRLRMELINDGRHNFNFFFFLFFNSKQYKMLKLHFQ